MGVIDTDQSKEWPQFSLYECPGTVVMKFHKLDILGMGSVLSSSGYWSEFKAEPLKVLEKDLLRPLFPHPLRGFPLSLSTPFPVWEITSIIVG